MTQRHALILAINTSILAVLFAFTAWLYRTERAAVDVQVEASLSRSAKMAGQLATLREKELSGLAQSVAASPQLRGALATSDAETISDVLRGIGAKNDDSLLAVVDGRGRVLYSNKKSARTAQELGVGRFAGSAPLENGKTLVVAQDPSRALVAAWSDIIGTSLILPADASRTSADAADFYVRRVKILDGRIDAELDAPRAPFWASFRSKRDSLAVLGAALFFVGLLLSVIFAELIGRVSTAAQTEDWVRLVSEIEAARERSAKT